MNRLLTMICSAAVMLAVSSNGFADVKATKKNTPVAAKSSNSCKPAKPCKPVKKPKPCEPCKPEPCCFFEQGLSLVDDAQPPCDVEYFPGYNAAAAISVDNAWDFNIDASFIYWDYNQDAMDFAFILPTAGNGSTVSSTSGLVAHQKTGYKPGFKVGIGWDTHFDNWTVNGEYMWFHHKQSDNASVSSDLFSSSTPLSATPVGSLALSDWFPERGIAPGTLGGYAGATSEWSMHMDLVDLVIGRPYYQGTHLTVSPTVGLRGLWIRQTMDINMTVIGNNAKGPNPVSSFNSSHSWAVGPKIGVNTHWMITHGLRIEGMAGASVLYTRYTSIVNKIVTDFILLTPETTTVASSRDTNINALRPTLDLGLGLGYGMYMFRNSFFVDLAVRYDFAQFWSQNVMRTYVSQLTGRDNGIGDLYMHGLTVTLRCDF